MARAAIILEQCPAQTTVVACNVWIRGNVTRPRGFGTPASRRLETSNGPAAAREVGGWNVRFGGAALLDRVAALGAERPFACSTLNGSYPPCPAIRVPDP